MLNVLLLNIAHCSPLKMSMARFSSRRREIYLQVKYRYRRKNSPEVRSASRTVVRRTTPHSNTFPGTIFPAIRRRWVGTISITLLHASTACSRTFAITIHADSYNICYYTVIRQIYVVILLCHIT